MSIPMLKTQFLNENMGAIAIASSEDQDIVVASGERFAWFKTDVSCRAPATDSDMTVIISMTGMETITHKMVLINDGRGQILTIEVPGFSYVTGDDGADFRCRVTAGAVALVNVIVNTQFIIYPA